MPEHVPYIKDVAVDSVKTGLGGHTGNKGISNKKLCFRTNNVNVENYKKVLINLEYSDFSGFHLKRSLSKRVLIISIVIVDLCIC